MIPNFFNVVRKDIECFQDFINHGAANDEKRSKVCAVAVRAFAIFGMAVSIYAGLKVVQIATVGAALLQLARAVVSYVLWRDIFVLSANVEKGLLWQGVAVVGAGAGDVKDAVMGRGVGRPPRDHLTKDTIFRPMWDLIIYGVRRAYSQA